ncbi:MAG: ATP-binding cassette domain-containing protein [Anaeromicrobium sp.]|jgi:ATP-binding cassette subfamily F protein uup|uniref:ABC-F family ATP-binding cassette domain-containing protein n=1 Tax=Anaeromicrobium sp. TaxID=1929132 RepID=UPI0025EB8A6B|nr:ABC-F family ATP-binding cassette domain-containing protein [Anaeromicrobium sp.]MCT4594761.1 ATP-binding cassette domain-containing protein [Anaeromicrobium sp.]
MNVLSVENITKTYGEKILFKDISFNISDAEKIGIIGTNGTGKSSLLKILGGIDSPDSGTIKIPNGIRIEYLPQNPEFDPDATILKQIFRGESPILKLIREYESTLEEVSENPNNPSLQDKLLKLTDQMNGQDAWELESQVKTVLTKLGITSFNKKMKELSGGQKKRVALASALISPCDLLILDEPTNHMDNMTIDWLEKYLATRKGALLMITHDRYFLDRVVNKTLELDKGKMYTYMGNYSYFTEKKLERKDLESSMEKKRQSLYKKELEWIRTGAKARTTKQKARIQRFEDLKEKKINIEEENLEISVGHSRLGKKIIEINNISKSFPGNDLIKNFNYTFVKEDKIGIIGPNGMGKSTLLNLITGKLPLDGGSIDIGPTVKIGYFSQESQDMNPNLRAIEYIKEVAEFVTTADGTKISASQMMERFLFTSHMQWTYIYKLSGGERRRLYLLSVLMMAPNLLILDEPTNDLDIDTLKVLESYIDEFMGPVITVSHDRYFLDRICNKILSFEGQGQIVENVGNYSDYMAKQEELTKHIGSSSENIKKTPKEKRVRQQKLKFSYKEEKEYETIEEDIEKLEDKINNIDKKMETCTTDFTKLQELTEEKEKLEEELLYKLERQEYLDDLAKKIKNQ